MPNIIRGQQVDPLKLEIAKSFRQNMTETEKILWNRLRKNQLNEYHFRRQQIIDGFIADFYCHSARLVVEVDGPIHNQQVELDHARDELFISKGLQVLRVTNDEVIHNLTNVLEKILITCQSHNNFQDNFDISE